MGPAGHGSFPRRLHWQNTRPGWGKLKPRPPDGRLPGLRETRRGSPGASQARSAREARRVLGSWAPR